jgi:MFS family permease
MTPEQQKIQAQIGGFIIAAILFGFVALGLAWSWRWSGVIAATVVALGAVRVVVVYNLARRRKCFVITPEYERDKIMRYRPDGETVAYIVGIDKWAEHEERLAAAGIRLVDEERRAS